MNNQITSQMATLDPSPFLVAMMPPG